VIVLAIFTPYLNACYCDFNKNIPLIRDKKASLILTQEQTRTEPAEPAA
jgi:hypothetical protein